MTKFIVRRLFWTIPVILLVILLTFGLMRQIKGNPFRTSERAIPAEIQRNLERKFALDKPWYEQYIRYVRNVATFDLGPSLVLRNRTVNDIVSEHFPKSLELGELALGLRRDVPLERRLRDSELPRRDLAHLFFRVAVGHRRADERLDGLGEQDPTSG